MTSSKDRTCRVWDTTILSCCAIATGHTDAIGSVGIAKNKATFASRAAFIVSGGADKVLKKWSFPAHELEATSSSSFSSSSNKKKILALQVSHSVRAHDKDINAIAIAPNDSIIASGSQVFHIRLSIYLIVAFFTFLSGY